MDSYKTHKKIARLVEVKWAFASIAIALMTVLALIYKSYTEYITTGIILVGTLYIIYGYLNHIGQTFYSFAQLYGDITKYDAKIAGASPIDKDFEKVKKDIQGKFPFYWRNIELQNLDFKYNKEGKEYHLKNINLNIKRGQKIAFIGESGSGKSTILALIRGLYEPNKGILKINGEKLDKGFQRLKKIITLIPQDPEIFNNTIKYNITMDLPTNKEDLIKVINMARFGNVIKRLEKGLNTNVLEKGVSLSGGEKQRLALARGLLAAKKSDIVLLDEPTSSVDTLNESQIHDNIFKEFKNKTIISSIHRLHLLKKFDYIYMFEKGKIVAEGTLNDLMKNFKFRRVWRKYQLKKE